MKFRRKSRVIDAVQLPTGPDHDAVAAVVDFLEGTGATSLGAGAFALPGDQQASPGDWIAKDADGTLSVWAAPHFAATFTPEDEPAAD